MTEEEFDQIYAFSQERHTAHWKKEFHISDESYVYSGRGICRDLTGSTDLFHTVLCGLDDIAERKNVLKEYCIKNNISVEHCDGCERPITRMMMSFGMTERPSDPHEFVCVLAGCQECFPLEADKSFYSLDQLNHYFDSGEAEKDGYLFLTV